MRDCSSLMHVSDTAGARPADPATENHVATPALPERLRASWQNVGTREDQPAVCPTGAVSEVPTMERRWS